MSKIIGFIFRTTIIMTILFKIGRCRCFPKHIRIAPFIAEKELPPYYLPEKGVYILDAFMVSLLSQKLKFSYELIRQESPILGRRLPNGSWTGMIGMVQRGEADMSLAGLAVTEERSQVVSFTYPYLISDVTFATDKPRYLPISLAIFRPFSWEVWVALTISMLCVTSVFYILMNKKCNYGRILLTTFGSLLGESINFEIIGITFRLLTISWMIVVLCLISIYNSLLLAVLTFPTLSGIFTVQDLSVATLDPSFRCFLTKGSYLYEVFSNSNDLIMRRIVNCYYRANDLPFNTEEILKNVTFRKAVIAGRLYLSYSDKDYYLSKDSFFSAMVGIAIRKNFDCKDTMDNTIHWLTATGLTQKFERDIHFHSSLSSISQESSPASNDSGPKQLTLPDLSDVFMLWLLGIFLSGAVFLLEIIIHKRKMMKCKNL